MAGVEQEHDPEAALETDVPERLGVDVQVFSDLSLVDKAAHVLEVYFAVASRTLRVIAFGTTKACVTALIEVLEASVTA